jgi:hypothetical protein
MGAFQPLDVEFKETIKDSRALSIARGEVYAHRADGKLTLCAAMQQTLMMLPDTPDHPD